MKIQRSLCLPLAASAALSFSPALRAQAPGKPAAAPATASTVGAITLPVTVVNGKGDPVKNLQASTLTLVDDGHPQNIQSFSPAQPAPMAIGILGQTSNDLKFELGDERLASVHFVDHTLPGTDDKFFVVQFADEVDLLEDPTANVNKLHDAINQLGSPQFGSQSGNQSGSQSGSQDSGARRGHAFGGALYDAIYLACTEVLKQQPGRHILVMVSDGVDRGSKETLNEAIEAAQSTNTMVFSIYYKGQAERENNPGQNPGGSNRRGGIGFPGGGGGYPGGGGGYPGGGGGYPGGGGGRRGGGEQRPEQPSVDGQKILEQLGNATGGYMIEGKHDKADDAYNKLAALLKNQYTLTFVPSGDAATSSYHHLSLTTKEKDVWTLVQQNYAARQH